MENNDIHLYGAPRLLYCCLSSDHYAQVVKNQLETDNKLLDLVKTMIDVWSFVDDVKSLPEKLKRLEEIIDNIQKQTVECAIFIREYTGHGFGGRLLISHYGPVVDRLFRQSRQAVVV